jgi:hypothetical protein
LIIRQPDRAYLALRVSARTPEENPDHPGVWSGFSVLERDTARSRTKYPLAAVDQAAFRMKFPPIRGTQDALFGRSNSSGFPRGNVWVVLPIYAACRECDQFWHIAILRKGALHSPGSSRVSCWQQAWPLQRPHRSLGLNMERTGSRRGHRLPSERRGDDDCSRRRSNIFRLS